MRAHAVIASAAFIACILAANYVTTEFGMVWVFGLTATAGTYLAGVTFVLRDLVQDLAGKWASVGLVALAAVVSLAISNPAIAVASGVAFLVAELADLAIYTPLRSRGYVRAAVASNVAGSIVDTILFLWIAGFGLSGVVVAGQVAGKLAVTLLVVLVVSARRLR